MAWLLSNMADEPLKLSFDFLSNLENEDREREGGGGGRERERGGGGGGGRERRTKTGSSDMPMHRIVFLQGSWHTEIFNHNLDCSDEKKAAMIENNVVFPP